MRSLLLPMALACAFASLPAQVLAHNHAQPDSPAAAAPAPTTGWATDAPLRDGMQAIRAAVEALGHYQHGHLGPAQAATLAGQIEGHVRDIIANCKLAPEADAALHAIIVPIMQHATALHADPQQIDEIEPMRQALAAYARQFDDPGARE